MQHFNSSLLAITVTHAAKPVYKNQLMGFIKMGDFQYEWFCNRFSLRELNMLHTTCILYSLRWNSTGVVRKQVQLTSRTCCTPSVISKAAKGISRATRILWYSFTYSPQMCNQYHQQPTPHTVNHTRTCTYIVPRQTDCSFPCINMMLSQEILHVKN